MRECRRCSTRPACCRTLNPGVMTRGGARARCARSRASMGMMLETASERLSRARRAAFRLARQGARGAARDDRGRRRGCGSRSPRGILIGIGETRRERIEALLAMRDLHERARPRPGGDRPELPRQARHADGRRAASRRSTSCSGRSPRRGIVLGPDDERAGAAEPEPRRLPRLLDAGINDWGGVSPVTIDHVNPEAPWPELERARGGDRGARARARAARLTGLPGVRATPSVARRRACCRPCCARPTRSASPARTAGRPGDGRAAGPVRRAAATRCRVDARDGELGRGRDRPPVLAPAARSRQRVFAAADRLRREVYGEDVTYVVTRNIKYTNVCYFRCGFCAFSKGKLATNLRGRALPRAASRRSSGASLEAWERGATEVCLQGGIHPGFDGDYYASVVRAIKDAVPEHARPRLLARSRSGRAPRRSGFRSTEYLARAARRRARARCPGTAAEILDDEVRARHLPRQGHDRRSGSRCTTPRTGVGLRSNNTIMFGHVDGPRALGAAPAARARAAGADGRLHRVRAAARSCTWRRRSTCKGRARHGPDVRRGAADARGRRGWRCTRAIENVQVSWVKLGPEGVAARAARAASNDLGGTLMNESISRAAGAGLRPGDAAGADGGDDPRRRPRRRASGRRSTARPTR